jgi:hypothetical protein
MAAWPARWHGDPMLTSRVSRIVLLSLVSAVVAVTANASAASAAQRHADPNGSGTDCSAVKPCGVTTAIENAAAGDEVIVRPGDYPVTDALFPPTQVTIHGVAGQPRPRILFNSQAHWLYIHHGSTLRHMEIRQESWGVALSAWASIVDQVVLTGAGPGFPTARIDNSTIRNSVVVASGTNGRAIQTSGWGSTSDVTSSYRNVTAIATGVGGVAIEADAGSTGKATANLMNVIARGPAFGLSAKTDSSGAKATINFAYSNRNGELRGGTNADIVPAAGNLAAYPNFVNPATGDYRQAPGSPTIDAGLDVPGNGEFDLDGDSRVVGTTADIGADEFAQMPAEQAPAPASAAPATNPAAAPPSAAPAFAGVKLLSSRLTFRGRFIVLKLSCPAGTAGRCSGRTKLTARRRTSSGAARSVTLGRAPFSIAPGSRATVRVRVTRGGRRLLGRVRRLRGRDVNAARDGAGVSKTTAAAVTIRRRAR